MRIKSENWKGMKSIYKSKILRGYFSFFNKLWIGGKNG